MKKIPDVLDARDDVYERLHEMLEFLRREYSGAYLDPLLRDLEFHFARFELTDDLINHHLNYIGPDPEEAA